MRLSSLIRSSLPALASIPVLAQEPIPLVLAGDNVPGVGVVTQIDNLAIVDDGEWMVECDTNSGNTAADSVLLRGGAVYLQENDAVVPVGTNVDTFDSMVLSSAGNVVTNFILANTPQGNQDDEALYFDLVLVLQEGNTSSATGFSPGTIYSNFTDAKLTESDLVLIRGFADDPNIPGAFDYYAVRLDTDGLGNLIGETVIAKEGDVPAGQTLPINTIRTGPHSGAINASGDVIWCADLSPASVPDEAVAYLNGALIAQEGMPSPVPGRDWGDIVSPEVDLNDAGDWTLKDKLDNSDPSTDDIIVKNGAKFVQAGDTLPDIAPFVLTYFGNGPADLDEEGNVLWFGRWNDPDTTRDEGLFLNDTLIVQEGVTQVGAAVFEDVGDQSENYYISRDGRWVIFEATLAGGVEGAFLLEIPIGDVYCTSFPNSTGAVASLSAYGDLSVASNDMTLQASGMPPNQFGYFLTSETQGDVPLPMGSQGRLCLAGQIARFNSQVLDSGAMGVFELTVDLTTIPTAPPMAVAPGDTWNYQAWFRDLNPNATSNFTDAVAIVFE